MAKHFVWLSGLTALAIWFMPGMATWAEGLRSLLLFLPFILPGLGIFISVYLNRLQPIMIFASLLLLNVGMTFFAPPADVAFTSTELFSVLTVLWPLTLLLWLLFPEKGLQSQYYVLLQLSLLVGIVYAVYWLINAWPLPYWRFLLAPSGYSVIHLPWVAMVITLAVFFTLLFRYAFLNPIKVLDLAAVFVLMVVAYGLNGSEQTSVLAWMIAMAAGMVLLSMVFDAHQMAYIDPLTGLEGRRALLESFVGLGRKYTIAMVDIDHFKKVNDVYGHDVGDRVLQMVAQALALLSTAQVYRYGGEAFALVFKGQTPTQAYPFLDEVRQSIATQVLSVPLKGKKEAVSVTISGGMATRTAGCKQPKAVMKCADQALYQAKSEGRNRLRVAAESAASG